jgi:large subunit ribosomal protein L3
MKFILGTKAYMTQIFDENDCVQPVTAINAGPVTVVQVKTLENDGYDSVQFGYGSKKEKNIKKPQIGHNKGLGNFSHIVEEGVSEEALDVKVGDTIDVKAFSEGDVVMTSSISKAKGFQGVVKRHNFSGGPRSHGQKHTERSPGSIGAGGVQRVRKGMRMGGRMGGDRITQKSVTIIKVDPVENILYVRGAIPGRKGTLVEIRG